MHSLSLALLAVSFSLAASWVCAADAASPSATYTNPVGGDIRMGDPFILFHDGQYYLYGTAGRDGFQCWRSSDLVHWESLGYAYQRTEDSWGVTLFWAPEVTEYRGRFYMVYSCQGRDKDAGFRLGIASGDSPAGPFVELRSPWLDNGWSCIDAHLFIDDDGTPYLFFDKVGAITTPTFSLYGIIYALRLTPDLTAAAGEPVLCAQADQPWEELDPKHPSRCNEGAFVFKHGKTYYMTYSSGHYASAKYAIGYSTASSPLGPWTKSLDNPLLISNAAANVSGPGHSCMTLSPDGKEMFIVYHAHADPSNPSGNRTVNIDRVTIDEKGKLHVAGPTRSPQPMPSAARQGNGDAVGRAGL